MELPTPATTGTPAPSRSRLANLRIFGRRSPIHAPEAQPPMVEAPRRFGLRPFRNQYASGEDNGGLPRRLFLPGRHRNRDRSGSDTPSRPSTRSNASSRSGSRPSSSGASSMSSGASVWRTRGGYLRSWTEGSGRLPFKQAIKDSYTRRKLINTSIAGLVLALVLAIYLAFTLTNSLIGEEFRVMLILLTLIVAVFFLHSVIRFIIVLLRGPPEFSDRPPSQAGPMGYATPPRPIHVILARDEELGEDVRNAGNKVTHPPPAYGLWRSSVRINPNLLYWQRVDEAVPKVEDGNSNSESNGNSNNNSNDNGNGNSSGNGNGESRPATAYRPPSYVSDIGVDYVLNAEPRSIAPRGQNNTAPPS
ncbi:hypothetical protein DTO027B5_248 [Paecilomyces variotii]|nr:hypothetical protein DTO027B3_2513 [Paecilomyces variotii]KAJ9338096.1 hypothetical protein DTO027B5_248 [Paecilomyces variotii]